MFWNINISKCNLTAKVSIWSQLNSKDGATKSNFDKLYYL